MRSHVRKIVWKAGFIYRSYYTKLVIILFYAGVRREGMPHDSMWMGIHAFMRDHTNHWH